jgi:protein Tex
MARNYVLFGTGYQFLLAKPRKTSRGIIERMITLIEHLAQTLQLRPTDVQRTLALLDEGNTIPFIARYRKEVTGELDEEQLRQIGEQAQKFRAVAERRESIRQSLTEQGVLTAALAQALDTAVTLTALEDLYQPYKKKRQTRASKARERGLQPLADLILGQKSHNKSLEQLAQPYLSDDVPDSGAAWAGASDIVAETIADQPEIRGQVRQKAAQFGTVQTSRVPNSDDPKGVYTLYYEFAQRVDKLRPHQVLALNRGEAEKILRVKLDVPERDWLRVIASRYLPRRSSPFAELLEGAIQDAAQRLLLPAIERDVRRLLTEQAEAHAIEVFAANLRGLLTQPPLAGQVVLALDPGFRTGCKVAVVDVTGKVLDTAVIYPHPPQNQPAKSQQTLQQLVQKHTVTLIAIGNGTASRETEQLVADLIRNHLPHLHYLMVSEAGASVYSASPLAKEELPTLDVTLRGAVSIARRVQDPLAELVKIDPQSIGVGLYQHDVNQKQLAEALAGVVESVVNQVGVELNNASPALLTYVAGIGPKLASKIVAHREAQGAFGSREALKKVAGLGPKAFEQAAGFLRLNHGREPLDRTAIHPESYPIARKLLTEANISLTADSASREAALRPWQEPAQLRQSAQAWGVGEPTLRDIVAQLLRPGRDPREDVPPPVLRQDVLQMADLHPGLRLTGTVRNVVDFGAFIDIGVKQDGLLHRSQLPRGKTLTVGDIIDVTIQSVEENRGRIALGWVEG